MSQIPKIITVSLNPAVDRVLEVEHFALGGHQVGREISRQAGGKAVNVSRVLAGMGISTVIATGFLGQHNRSIFDKLLASAGVANEFFELPGRTRENVTISDPTAGQETHIRDTGLTIDEVAIERLSRKLRTLAQPGNIVIFGGSLPPGVDATTFAELVDQCITAGARVAVDTSGEALAAMQGKRLWLVKPNEKELPDLVGRAVAGKDDTLAIGRELAATIENVILTRGADGAWLFAEETTIHATVNIEPGAIRNKVGCGDVLLGAFVGGVATGQDLREAFGEAVLRAAASACETLTAEFDGDIVKQLRPQLHVENA